MLQAVFSRHFFPPPASSAVFFATATGMLDFEPPLSPFISLRGGVVCGVMVTGVITGEQAPAAARVRAAANRRGRQEHEANR
jgi:hypothetical protein